MGGNGIPGSNKDEIKPFPQTNITQTQIKQEHEWETKEKTQIKKNIK